MRDPSRDFVLTSRSRSPIDRGAPDPAEEEDEGYGLYAGASFEESSAAGSAGDRPRSPEGDVSVTMSKRDLQMLAEAMGAFSSSLLETLEGVLAVATMLKKQADGLIRAKKHIENLCDQCDLADRDEAEEMY